MERTLSIVKPDGVARGLIGEVVKRLETNDLRIVAMKMIHMSRAQAEGFYAVHKERPFFGSLTDFMSSGPCVVMVLEGDDAIARYRELMGATNYKDAARAPSAPISPRTSKRTWSTAPTRRRRPPSRSATFSMPSKSWGDALAYRPGPRADRAAPAPLP